MSAPIAAPIAFEIVELALSLAKGQASGEVQTEATLAYTVVQIIGKALQAYRDQTGQALDPSLLKAEEPV